MSCRGDSRSRSSHKREWPRQALRASTGRSIAPKGCVAGPARTVPSASKREPWQGQSHDRSASFHSTRQPLGTGRRHDMRRAVVVAVHGGLSLGEVEHRARPGGTSATRRRDRGAGRRSAAVPRGVLGAERRQLRTRQRRRDWVERPSHGSTFRGSRHGLTSPASVPFVRPQPPKPVATHGRESRRAGRVREAVHGESCATAVRATSRFEQTVSCANLSAALGSEPTYAPHRRRPQAPGSRARTSKGPHVLLA